MVGKTDLAPVLKEVVFRQGREQHNQQLKFKCGMGCAWGTSGATGTQKRSTLKQHKDNVIQ